MSEPTVTITAPVASTFVISAYIDGVEVGPRLTYRRTAAENVQVGDRLADTFGQPNNTVLRVTATPRQVSLLTPFGPERFERGEAVSVFVSSEDVAPVFVPGVTPVDAL